MRVYIANFISLNLEKAKHFVVYLWHPFPIHTTCWQHSSFLPSFLLPVPSDGRPQWGPEILPDNANSGGRGYLPARWLHGYTHIRTRVLHFRRSARLPSITLRKKRAATVDDANLDALSRTSYAIHNARQSRLVTQLFHRNVLWSHFRGRHVADVPRRRGRRGL